MSTVKVDRIKNRMYIKFNGFMKLEESKKLLDECIKASEKMKPGYTVLSDTTELKTLPQEVWDVIQKIRVNHIQHGILKSAIIINHDNHISNMQVKRTMNKMEKSFPEKYFSTEEAAIRYLEEA